MIDVRMFSYISLIHSGHPFIHSFVHSYTTQLADLKRSLVALYYAVVQHDDGKLIVALSLM